MNDPYANWFVTSPHSGLPSATWILEWWQFCNFKVWHVKFDRFLYPNEQLSLISIFWYFSKQHRQLRVEKNRAYFYKIEWCTWIKLKIFLPKVGLLVWNSDIKIIFRVITIKFILGLINWLRKLKMVKSDCPQSSCLKSNQKIL